MSEDLDAWDRWVGEQGRRAGFLQTATWARILAELDGASPVVLRHGESGGLWILRPDAPGHGVRARARRVLRRGRRSGVLECSDGPALPAGDEAAALPGILAAAIECAHELGARSVLVAPPSTVGWGTDSKVRGVLSTAGFECVEWMTLLVDLRRDESALTAALHRSARKAVRHAQSAGATVRRCEDPAEVEASFLRPFARWSGADEQEVVRRGRAMLAHDHDGAYEWLVAIGPDGAVAGTLGSVRHGGVATEIMSSRDPASALPLQDLLHWHALQLRRAAGDELFDLAGVNPAPVDSKEAGIRRFKEKWGGMPAPKPRYELHLEAT